MRRLTTILCVIFTLLIAGCGDTPPGSRNPEPKKLELTIGLMPDIDSVPFIVARERGFFETEGLSITLEQFKSAIDRDAAIQSGNIDGAVSDILAAAFLKSGGFDAKIISATDGRYALVAGEDSGISEILELKGEEIAISKNTIIEYITDQIIENGALRPGDVEKVTIPQIPARLEMLRNGKINAAVLPEPMAGIAVDDGCRYIKSSDDIGINPGVMVFTSRATSGKGDAIKAMYRAYNRAVEYLRNTRRAEYVDFVVERSGFPKGTKETLRLPKYRKASPPNEKDFQKVIGWLYEKKLISEKYKYRDLVAEDLLP